MSNSMEMISKAITSFTKHPMKMPQTLAFGVSFIMSRFTFTPEMYKSLDVKKTKFKTSDGKKLYLKYLSNPVKNPDGKKRLMIFVHGFGNSCNYMLRYAGLYFDKGYDFILYDQRGHGKSSKYSHSMGYFESDDLVEIANSYRAKLGKDAIIGVHGESMGSATAYAALSRLAKSTDFAICDCGYSDMSELAAHIAKLFFMFDKKKVLEAVDKFSEVDGKRYSDLKPIDSVRATSSDYPVYMIHGGGDFFVPTHMTRDMYEVKQGKKKIDIYYKAFHACSQFLHPQEYTENVNAFLKEFGIEE